MQMQMQERDVCVVGWWCVVCERGARNQKKRIESVEWLGWPRARMSNGRRVLVVGEWVLGPGTGAARRHGWAATAFPSHCNCNCRLAGLPSLPVVARRGRGNKDRLWDGDGMVDGWGQENHCRQLSTRQSPRESSETVRGYSRGRENQERSWRTSRVVGGLLWPRVLSRLLSPFHLLGRFGTSGLLGFFSGPKFQVSLRVGLAGLACFGCPLLVGCRLRPALKLLIRRT